MDMKKLNDTACRAVYRKCLLAQDQAEWECFLEFAANYFENRGIEEPVVVEIGIMKGIQKIYYETLMGAKHIGVDCNINTEPDILGDSGSAETVERLMKMTGGAKIDLLFIDGNHAYDAAKRDYELWEPVTQHLVVLHDIRATNNSKVNRLWGEIKVDRMTVEFNRYNTKASMSGGRMIDMGTGVIIKEQ